MFITSQKQNIKKSFFSYFQQPSAIRPRAGVPFRAIFLVSLLQLSACNSFGPNDNTLHTRNSLNTGAVSEKSLSSKTNQARVQKRKYYSVKIPMHDGVKIAATIYQPELKAGEVAPLILHSHGFSMYRMRNPRSFYGLWMFAGQTSLAAWKQGYWVISYDQRGHGDSEGIINLISPEHEVKDVSSIIDWAVENLPHLAFHTASHSQTLPEHQAPLQAEPPITEPSTPKLIRTALNQQTAQHNTTQTADNKLLTDSIRTTQAQRSAEPDPLVGMIGESYTGSAQLLAATFDKRIDALVPMTTWFDLNKGLVPGHVPKSGWLTTLILSGNALNPSSMNPKLNYAYREVRKGVVSQSFVKQLEERSFSHFCHSNTQPGADALIMQSFRDSLFNFNHGVAIQQCLKAAGHDVRLIGTRTGHLLPFSQTSGFKTIYSFDREVHCDSQSLSTQQMVLDWFDEKLRHKTGRADYIPPLCVTLNDSRGVNMEQFPTGGKSFWVDPVKVSSGMAGFWELALKPTDMLFSALMPRTTQFNTKDFQPSGGTFRPAFIPLTAGNNNTYVAGIPSIDFKIKSTDQDSPDPTLFVGLGIKRSYSPRVKLVNDQITPLSGTGRHQQVLSAVSTPLQKGELLGLVIYTYSNQFRFSGSGAGTEAVLEGQIEIPLHTSRPLMLTDLGELEQNKSTP